MREYTSEPYAEASAAKCVSYHGLDFSESCFLFLSPMPRGFFVFKSNDGPPVG